MSRKGHQKWDSKFAKNEIAGLRHFLPSKHLSVFFLVCFVRAFGGLWVLLGRPLGFLRFFKGSCWLFKANDGPLGFILVSLVNLFKVLCKSAGPKWGSNLHF